MCVMVLGLGVNLIPPLLVFNFVFYLTGACLASWGLNINIDSQNVSAQNDIGKIKKQYIHFYLKFLKIHTSKSMCMF